MGFKQDINSATTQNQWLTRTVDLSAYAGKTVSTMGVVTDSQTGAVTWDEYYSDLAIVSADGTVTTIYERAPAISLTESNSAGVSNATGVVERTNTAGDSEYPGNTTTYYLSDQIGSARMLLAAGGWPVSEDTYYPYGVEPTPPADVNHYKFAGMERDAESGLDHTWFRQYAATAGQFMSPDPYNGSYDITNPQSFNRYSYVENNPVNYVDPLGLTIDCVSFLFPVEGGYDGTYAIGVHEDCVSFGGDGSGPSGPGPGPGHGGGGGGGAGTGTSGPNKPTCTTGFGHGLTAGGDATCWSWLWGWRKWKCRGRSLWRLEWPRCWSVCVWWCWGKFRLWCIDSRC